MDITTIVGLISGFTLIVMAILSGGQIGYFIDAPSLLLVAGGSYSAILVSFSLQEVVQIPGVLVYVFGLPRKYMSIALPRLHIGVDSKTRQQLMDAYPPADVSDEEAAAIKARLTLGVAIFDRARTFPLAFGGVGIFVGAVIVLANAKDLSQIGPGVATAIISPLYGLVLYILCTAIRNKLERRLAPLQTD